MQSRLEKVGRYGAMGERHLLGRGSEPPHWAGGDQDPRHEVCARGLDVDASCHQHEVTAYALDAGETAGWLTKLPTSPGPALAVARSLFGDRQGVGH